MRHLKLPLALAALALAAHPALADRELVMFTPEQYGASPLCCLGCDDLPNAIQDGQHFDNAFADYDVVQQWNNQAVDGENFGEADWLAWGDDESSPTGTDWADVIFYSGHGSRTCSSSAWYSSIVMGEADKCSPRTAYRSGGGTQGHLRFGGDTPGRDANAYVLFTCQSAHKCVWEEGGYSPMDQGQFNILNGFHGLVWEASGYQDDLKDYGYHAKWNDMGDAWLDDLYRYRYANSSNCPVAILWGANEAEMDDFFENAGWFDFHNTGSHTQTGFYYLKNCNPRDGDKL